MKANGWISVKDRLPEIGEYVFIVIEMKYEHEKEIETVVDIGWLCADGDFSMLNDWYEGQQHFQITHWQPVVFPEIIDKEIKISNVVLKRYTASKGKSLKWDEWVMNPDTRECEKVLRYAECTAVIDINQLDGSIMEIPYGEYKEWWDNNYHCLGVAGL